MKKEEKEKTEAEKKIDGYREKNRLAREGQVLFVGSSLMEMFPIEEMAEAAGCRQAVYNRGVGGFTTEDLLQAMDVCIYDVKPSRIFINIGTNDLSNPERTVEWLVQKYETIITLIEEHLPKAEIYMMAYYPVNYEAASEEMKPCLLIRNNKRIAKANEKIKKLAAAHGEKYIDVNDKLKDAFGNLKKEYTIEGMHINERGYQAIAEDVIAYINEAPWKK